MRRHLLILFELFPSLSDGGAHGLELVVGVAHRRRGLRQVLHSLGRPLHRRRQLSAEKEGGDVKLGLLWCEATLLTSQ